MKKLSAKLVLFSFALCLSSCDKDKLDIRNGTYAGTFTATYSSGTFTGPTTVELENGRYSCTGNPDRIPAGGSGSYTVDNDTITFQDENFWTMDFDGNLILNGAYGYTIDKKKLKISAERNGLGLYVYDLERQ